MGRHSSSRDRRRHRSRSRESRRHRHHSTRSRSSSPAPVAGNTLRATLDALVNQAMKDPSVTGVAPGDKTGASGLGAMLMTISDSTTGSYSGVSSLAISGIPVTITPDEICNSINILMKCFKLSTGPGNPCSCVGMEANGSTAVADMRSAAEATNGLALDGLTVFNHVMHVNRPENYTGPDTEPPKLDPNLLLQVCTGTNAEEEYREVVSIGRKLLETYHEEEAAPAGPTVNAADESKEGYDLSKCVLIHNIPTELSVAEIESFCSPFGGVKMIYPLKDKESRFLGDAVVEYRESLYYEIAMEGLQDLPIFNDTVLKVEVPDKKWPGFPQRVSVVSNPSPVLRMSNIISLEDLEEDEDYEALLEDLRQGCAEFGTVVKLHVPRIHHGEKEIPGLGYAFVQYASVLEAAGAAKALRLKTFNGKQVQVDYYPLSLFTKEVVLMQRSDT
ncbi:hypothetical protein WA577_000592 [Blastocystis sp. JDR]